MTYYLNEICSIQKPTFDGNGNIIWEDFGDYFYAIDKTVNERYIPRYISHKAKIEADGIMPGNRMVTNEHDYIVAKVDRKKGILGLVIIK